MSERENSRDFKYLIENLRNRLNSGNTLSVADLGLYSVVVRKGAYMINEPSSSSSWKSANIFCESWDKLLEKKGNGHNMEDVEDWREVRDTLDPDGETAFLSNATSFIDSRIKEIEEFNRMGVVNETVLDTRNRHIQSLSATNELIVSLVGRDTDIS